MKSATIVPVAFLAVILASGCTEVNYFPATADRTTIGAADLIENVSEYYGQEHTFIGSPVKADGELFGYYISDGDRRLYLNYTDFGCMNCLITGGVGRVALCDCWSASCSGAGCEPHDEEWEFLDSRPSEDCEGRVATMVLGNLVVKNFFRCEPGTETHTYYFQVREAEDAAASG